MFLRGLQIATEASSAQFETDEVDATPPGPATTAQPSTAQPSTAQPSATRLDVVALRSRFSPPGRDGLGSNAIAVGSQDTAAGDGMVLANPHYPWQGTERFWMAQLTVPLQYDVLGGTLEGFPLIGIGFNQHVAWTHTVSTSFRFTLYQLKLVPGDPTSYYVDGRPEKMGQLRVSVDDGHGTQTHTFYTTRWGTVLVVPQARYGWTVTTAYALADAELTDGPRAANQFFVMGLSNSVEDLLEAESTYLATPTFNTVAADDKGRVLYADVGNTPNVTQRLISACMPGGAAQLVFAAARVVTLDGSRSACAWGTDESLGDIGGVARIRPGALAGALMLRFGVAPGSRRRSASAAGFGRRHDEELVGGAGDRLGVSQGVGGRRQRRAPGGPRARSPAESCRCRHRPLAIVHQRAAGRALGAPVARRRVTRPARVEQGEPEAASSRAG